MDNLVLGRLTIGFVDQQMIPGVDELEKPKVSVSVATDDGVSSLSGERTAFKMARTKSKCAAAGAREDNQINIFIRHPKAGYRISVCPGPGSMNIEIFNRTAPGTLNQILANQCFGMNPTRI